MDRRVRLKDLDFRQWLESLGLSEHFRTFIDNDIGLDAIRLLSDTDMEALGLSLGHRRILQRAIALLPAPTTESDPAAVRREQGELRQITVLFCDLVGSSALSDQFDPEDLRKLIHGYYTTCCRIIEESSGFVARIIGDGILAYFGYPQAREDAAECAARAGLRIVETLRQASLDPAQPIKVRIGIATGVSVISDMVGIGFSELHAVTGATPNVAARIQSLAEPDTVVVADETRRLVGGLLAFSDLGQHRLRGFQEPVRIWRVVGEPRSTVRFDAQHPARVECIGRDTQIAELCGIWRDAQGGGAPLVDIVGDAGIGKSRLMRTAWERLVPAPATAVVMQCVVSQAGTPLHPLIDWMRSDIGVSTAASEGNRARLERWLGTGSAQEEVPLIAEFLGVPMQPACSTPSLPPDRKRQLTREIVLRHFERKCRAGPMLLMVEDVHWIDGATREFLAALLDRMHSQPFVAMTTRRPGQPARWSDVTGVAASVEFALDCLSRQDARRLVESVCQGHSLPPPILEEILAKTDGIPLFIEELTTTVLESAQLRAKANPLAIDRPSSPLEIPSTLRDSLMARLDRLGEVKQVARTASAIGRDFSFALLAQVSGADTASLHASLDRLVKAQLLFQRGQPPSADYTFKHALIQQAAYDSQLRSDRAALHARIVLALEAHHPDVTLHEPGLMAHHSGLAGMTDREVDYLYAAGQASTRIVAVPEALSYYARAEAALDCLVPSPHNARRHISIILGMMDAGRFTILPGRLGALSERARTLAGTEGVNCDAEMHSTILFQEARAKLYSSHYAEARRIFQEIRRLGTADNAIRIERKPASAFGMTLCCQGLFNEMLQFMDEGNIRYYKESGSFIDYISGLGWIAYARCQTGSVDDGIRLADLCVEEAQQVQSQIYLAGAHIWRSHARMAATRYDEAIADADHCISLSRIQGVPYLTWHGLVFLSLCQCRAGDVDAATRSLEQARELLTHVEDGLWSLLDYLPAIEAEIASLRGDHGRATTAADEAIALARSSGGHYAEAIAWRVKAISALMSGLGMDEASAHLRRAIQIHEQGGALAEIAYSRARWNQALRSAGLATNPPSQAAD